MPDQGGERTEKASPRKREDERKKGNVFQSKDATVIASVLIAFFTVSIFISFFLRQLDYNFALQLDRMVSIDVLTADDIMNLFFELIILFAKTVLPVLVIIGIASFILVGVQTRFLFSYEQIKFKFERINPLNGIKKLFSLRSVVELLKAMLKMLLLVWILWGNVKKVINILPSLIDWELVQGVKFAGGEIMSLVIAVAIAFGIVAAADYLYQYWEYEKGIRMTKQEVKDEYKQMEGNPEVKSARRQKQREYAQRRMMENVKEADIVVRNPTHYAVALKYKLDEDTAPVVVAKGKDNIALKIIEEAEKYSIATVENRPLARSLYELADIDDLIPPELYQPVAELLAWFYSQDK